MKTIKSIKQIAYHRNGITGNGFYAVLFTAVLDEDTGAEGQFLASVFDEPGSCSVICLDRIGEYGVSFGANSWRGDNYEQELRDAIKKYDYTGSV